MKRQIYLDTIATTRVHPEVIQAMLPYFTETYGNPSSLHALGEQAFTAMTNSRTTLANIINARPEEIIFTSGGTEANNLALFGIVCAQPHKKKIFISAIEHSSIKEPCSLLRQQGYEIHEIKVNAKGLIDMNELAQAIDATTALVSIIHGNNEIGTLQDLEAIGSLCQKRNVLFHTDAVQSFGKTSIDVRKMHIDLLSSSAHKIHGPKGMGFLYVKNSLLLSPLIIGGGQEKGRRGGTENIPGIIGFAKALSLTTSSNQKKIVSIRDFLINELEKRGGVITGSKEKRLSNQVSFFFKGIDAELLVAYLSQRGIFCSTRSACLSKEHKESHVLKAIGLSREEIRGALRFGLSSDITEKDIQRLLKVMDVFLKNE